LKWEEKFSATEEIGMKGRAYLAEVSLGHVLILELCRRDLFYLFKIFLLWLGANGSRL
jgi:hypothetical protein